MPLVIDDRVFPSWVCSFCSRLRDIDKKKCDAFPRTIPDVIWDGENDHTEPFEGDHDLQFNFIDEPDGQESDKVI